MAVPEHDPLPEELPTIEDLTAPPRLTCVLCGSDAVRTDSPASRYVLLIGGVAAGWMLLRGPLNAALVFIFSTLVVAGMVRKRYHFRRCDRCGHEWHRADQLGE